MASVSARVVTRLILVCDGCGTEFDEHPNATEARAAAYGAGWRYPSKVKANGTQATRTSDVCPKCLPGWVPPLSPNGDHSSQRRT